MSAELGGRHAIPQAVSEVIEHQRSQLMDASTVLACLWIASLYQEWHDVEIDAGSVALVVRRIIDNAVSALDSVELARAVDGLDVSNARSATCCVSRLPPVQHPLGCWKRH